MTTEIHIENLRKSFGTQLACDIPSLDIAKGEIIGLVGNNGAGKTTLFRLMLDLLLPDEGGVWLKDILTKESEEWKTFTGAYIDESFLINYLTPEEYFQLEGRICGLEPKEVEERLKAFSHFMNGEIIGQKKLIRELSAGNRQKTGIMAAMLARPEILILDEPFNYLDPSGQLIIKRILTEYVSQTNATVLISSHNLRHTTELCTRLLLLEKGRILKDVHNDHGEAVKEIEHYFEQA